MTIPDNLPQVVALVNDGGCATDEIRFGATWSSVLPTTLPPQCPGDFDNDGAVGGSDLAMLLGAWGGEGADLNGDNVTDASDLAVLLGAWGSCD
ncbi:MAG: hypothetical protein SGJ11_14985 [Phycisphaerae bacterium]|nr:hypothetical protein [Phycisphaerae bacterium]